MSIQPLRTGGSIEETVEKYKNTVYAVAMTRTRNREDAQDVFQEVFLAYFRRQPSFNDEEHVKAWLINAAVRCSKKLVGKALAKPTVPLSEASEVVFDFGSDEDNLVYSALCSLPQKYSTVLHLFYIEDMSVEQISHALSAKEGTVRMQLTRGRAMLREKLKGDYFDEQQ